MRPSEPPRPSLLAGSPPPSRRPTGSSTTTERPRRPGDPVRELRQGGFAARALEQGARRGVRVAQKLPAPAVAVGHREDLAQRHVRRQRHEPEPQFPDPARRFLRRLGLRAPHDGGRPAPRHRVQELRVQLLARGDDGLVRAEPALRLLVERQAPHRTAWLPRRDAPAAEFAHEGVEKLFEVRLAPPNARAATSVSPAKYIRPRQEYEGEGGGRGPWRRSCGP
jgi:hypothetical protein